VAIPLVLDVFFSCVARFVTNESYLIRIPT
jgi:hypothetical protein